jgi:hypothetical protein
VLSRRSQIRVTLSAGLRADLRDKPGGGYRNRGVVVEWGIAVDSKTIRRAGVSKTRSQNTPIVMNRAERWDFGAATGRSIGEGRLGRQQRMADCWRGDRRQGRKSESEIQIGLGSQAASGKGMLDRK